MYDYLTDLFYNSSVAVRALIWFTPPVCIMIIILIAHSGRKHR